MAMPLTHDEQLVLRHLVSGETSEEIAAALNWPIQAVRNCTHTLITRVLDELEASGRTPSEYHLPALGRKRGIEPVVGSSRDRGVSAGLAAEETLALVADQRSRFGWRRSASPDLANDRDRM
jgi:hypothetical protein